MLNSPVMTIDAKTTAGLAVFTQLRAAERASNAAGQAKAELIATMYESHGPMGLQFGEGQPALESAVAALVKDVEARRDLVRSHARLVPVAIAAGFDWSMAGDNSDTPPPQKWQTTGVEAAVETTARAD